jgi:hypothetical protein
MEDVNAQIWQAALSLVGVILSWAALSARNWLKAKVQNEYVQQLLLRLTDAVDVGVRQVAQTLVPALKQAMADGKISEEEAANLRSMARTAAFDQLTSIDRKKLTELFDGEQLNRKLDQLVEAAVQRMKENSTNV